MSVSLYDLLDVPEDATSDAIRAAWKQAIADLDPTDRRFRAYNDAAEVLLDSDKRAAYDAELAAARDEAAPEPEPDLDVEPVATDADHEAAGDRGRAPSPAPSGADDTAGGPPLWLVYATALVAAASVALVVVMLVAWPGSRPWLDPSPAVQEDRAVEAESAGHAAETAAADAVPVVLGYDYRTIDEDFAAAEEFLTEEFAEKRAQLFQQRTESGLTLREQIVEDQVVVVAAVAATGLTRVSPDGDRATVVVYVDQDSQKGEDEPNPLRMWATLSMVEDDGDWLIDDICTEGDCG